MVFEQELLSLVHTHGLWGFFFATALASTSILFPLPVSLIIVTGSQLFGSIPSILVGSFGAGLGEFSTYFLFREGRLLLNNKQKKNMNMYRERIGKWGFWAILFFASLPWFPIDMTSMAAGLLKYNAAKYLIAVLLGRSIYFYILTYTGGIVINGLL